MQQPPMDIPANHDSALHQSVDLLRALEVGPGLGSEVAERLRELVSVVREGVLEGRLCASSRALGTWPAITESMSADELRDLAELLNSITGAAPAESHSLALAVHSALQRFEGDAELLGEVLEIFLEQVPIQLQQMHQAGAAGDTDRIAEIAHELRGAAANVGAEGLRTVACQVELDLKGGDPKDVTAELESLQVELARLRLAVEAFRAGGARS
ncbi:MAG: Hpt domain-containing protein [Planctomycetes bacterium]|nr:Hpt domain-containing protein [Planctomycetota bacterium]